MDKVFVKYNTETLASEGFYLKEQLEEGASYIEITKEKEEELREMTNQSGGNLFVVDIDKKEFEARVIRLSRPTTLESNDSTKQEVDELKQEVYELRKLISEMMNKRI